MSNKRGALDRPKLPEPLVPGLRWLVCHTRPRCEKKFAALMLAEQFTHYLPLIESTRRYGNRIKRFTKPLFPGYVFAWVPEISKPKIYQQELIARAIAVQHEAIFLEQLDDVRKIVASGLSVALHPVMKKGTRVRVINGPLYGLKGVVDNPAHPKGMVISIDVLRKGLLVRLPVESLEPVL